MPSLTHKQQIEQFVDDGIRAGRINPQYRQKYIDDFAADPGAAEYFAGGFMRAADYTNKQKERAAQEQQANAAIEQQRQAVAAERARLVAWEQQTQAEINRLRALEGDSARVLQMNAQMEQVIRDFKLTEQVPHLNGQPAGQPGYQPPPAPTAPSYAPPAQPAQPTTPPAWAVSREEATDTISRVLDLNGELQVIMAEHQFLFGSPLRENLIQEARQAGQLGNIRAYWEAKHNVPGKRAEVDEAARLDERKRMEGEIRASIMAELAADPTRVVGPHGFWQPEQTPLARTYMGDSRAATPPTNQHTPPSGTMPGPQPGVPVGDPPRPIPEQINHIQSVRSSVNAAVSAFNSKFNPDGSLLTGRDSRSQ